MAADKELDI